MIYVTGDLHGDPTRLKRFSKLFPKYRNTLLVCGDFGFVWNGSESEKKALQKLEKLDCNILFVEGTHDNIDLLRQYPEEEFCGGKVRRIGKNLFWMQRGELFVIEGKKVFALGGAESMDADERIPGVSWWPDELPSPEELDHARKTLEKAGQEVDLIITHQHPNLQLGSVSDRRQNINAQLALLRDMSRTVQFKKWYFGGEHLDRDLSPKLSAVFERVLEVKL